MYSVDKENDQEQVLFYSLSRKFVDEQDVPEDAREVMYYSLAIGHHLGVVDCLKVILQCTRQSYREWIELLPADGEAFAKMNAFFDFGEITILSEHIHMLALAFDRIDKSIQTPEQLALTQGLIKALTDIYHEPTMYLMVRNT